MDLNRVKSNLQSTPAYVFDKAQIKQNLAKLARLKKQSGCHVLYSIKALPLKFVLELAKSTLDGLSVSSLFEARLAKEILADEGSIHITTPGLRQDEFEEISDLCTHISFNSQSQFQRMESHKTRQNLFGLRLNPKLSFANDPRFDPCRPYSKLGVDIEELGAFSEKITGLHFHTVFSNTDYDPLVQTIELIKAKLGHQLSLLKWINLGGGYLYNQISNQQPFIALVKQLKSDYDLDVYVEPGKAVVGNAGYLVSTVIDRFISDGKQIAVVDTSVNHNPEVFEYQNKPALVEEIKEGKFSCCLVGSSCLAGDVFGDYRFNQLPKVGDKLTFANVGAYSLIKANRFNGYNLPDIYAVDNEKSITLLSQHTYQNYRQLWAG